jgi:hypothetical protein
MALVDAVVDAQIAAAWVTTAIGERLGPPE